MNVTKPQNMNTATGKRFPKFPPLLAKPVSFLPQRLPTSIIIKALNNLLTVALQEGDLDFLDGQSVSVEVADLGLRFAMSLEQQKLAARPWKSKDDLNLRGDLYDFLLLASRREDSDTLFFQRRLKMSGSTDLGLEVKNLLDGLEMESVRFHQPIAFSLKHGVSLYERLF